MHSFVKIKSSRNGEITLSFRDISLSCPSCNFFYITNMSFKAFRENKIDDKKESDIHLTLKRFFFVCLVKNKIQLTI